MNKSYYIKNAIIVNEGMVFGGGVYINDGLIKMVFMSGDQPAVPNGAEVIDAYGLHLIPGLIDDQVHFRDPGLTHKADLYTESKAAVAGGITSFMEMPNTRPQTLTQELLEEKYKLGSEKSLANFSFYMGASNDNLDEILKTDPARVCGIKVFMGASTGNMLVDDPVTLQNIFEKAPTLVAVHCEDEPTIQENTKILKERFGEDIPIEYHPLIRSEEACFKSSSFAVELAKKYDTRLHVLHLSTARELGLFDNSIPLGEKKITAEVCVHHLWFHDGDYERLGNFIKWNPAIKSMEDRDELLKGLLDNRIDVVATDHAPHTIEEKENTYFKAPSGGPLVQHSLSAMLELFKRGVISLEKVVEKMCHAPAVCFGVKNRGFIREGYAADLALVDLNDPWTVEKDNILYKCGWSPFEGQQFHSAVTHTFVNGHLTYKMGVFDESVKGKRLLFDRHK
ncbi:MAG: dihydroorotase [Bacteroidales bacterium]|nr:dihydroorotase [Bacteroidales bacterium]